MNDGVKDSAQLAGRKTLKARKTATRLLLTMGWAGWLAACDATDDLSNEDCLLPFVEVETKARPHQGEDRPTEANMWFRRLAARVDRHVTTLPDLQSLLPPKRRGVAKYDEDGGRATVRWTFHDASYIEARWGTRSEPFQLRRLVIDSRTAAYVTILPEDGCSRLQFNR